METNHCRKWSRRKRVACLWLAAIPLSFSVGSVDETFAAGKGRGGGGKGGTSSTKFSGDAVVVDATVTGFSPIEISRAGPVPQSGGAEDAHLLQVSVPGLLTAEVTHAAVVAQDNESRAEASVANVNLTVGGQNISAGFLMARAAAVCNAGLATISGSSEVVTLVVNGETIQVGTAPNQEINLVDALGVQIGRITINEQDMSVSGGTGDVTVTALHVEVFGVADVIISQAHADITCGAAKPPGDFITGGGWITGTPSRQKGNFGVAGGIRKGAFWGHLTYIDHGSQMRVKGTSITGYSVGSTPTSRVIEGTCEVNGTGGFTFTVEVADNGEPGRNDTFDIELSNGYSAGGSLGGGNIQLHDGS